MNRWILVVLCLLWPAAGAGPDLAGRLGFYQWEGVPVQGDSSDLLTQARRHATATGAKVFRFYLGARFDYVHHVCSPRAFADDNVGGELTPARILALPRYRAVIEDPKLETVILTTYATAEYDGRPDDLNLLRPWTAGAEQTERRQIGELCEFLYSRFGGQQKTVVIANSEADDKMLEIMNYTGSAERAIENIVAWTRARAEAIAQARAAHPETRLRILHGFEISVVNLRIGRAGASFQKSPEGTWNALRDVIPRIRFDLLIYSTYESINSPFETQSTDVDPAQVSVRLRRDLDRIRDRGRGSLSATGRRLFGERFVAAGELGFARDRFEHLATGGVAPRLVAALETALQWGCPYIVLWQVFDAPRAGGEQFGFGMIDRHGRTPRLRPGPGGCDSVRNCLAPFLPGSQSLSSAKLHGPPEKSATE